MSIFEDNVLAGKGQGISQLSVLCRKYRIFRDLPLWIV